MSTSLKSRLALGFLAPLGLAAVLGIIFAYRGAQTMATLVQDRLLLGSARTIAQQITYEDGLLEVAIPPAALELFESSDQDRVYYRIASANGVLLSGYTELPAPVGSIKPEEHQFFGATVRGQAVRVVAYAQPIFGAPGEGPVIIEVAQTRMAHDRLVKEIWGTSLRHDTWMIGLTALLIWLSLRGILHSIERFGEKVRDRDPGSLEPLDAGPIPVELHPLVAAINAYVQRLDRQMALRSRFIANAAHQLRTPLTVLQAQVNFGLRHAAVEDKDEALRAIFTGVRHLTRLVNQLLSLSCAEAGPGQALPVDLADLAQRVLEEQAALAQARDIDLGLEIRDLPVVISATQEMAHELLANLVDNALRYTPAGGVVTVILDRDAGRPRLRVEDNGPGIPEADRGRVFERFCRLHEGDTPGSGLGLAIAKEICQSQGAEIRLSDPASGHGLLVTLVFPG